MDIDSISFGAITINKIKIKKYNKMSYKFADYPVNFVKLDSCNRGDLEAVDRVAKKWKVAKYIREIATDAHWLKEKPRDVYALTSQQNNFEKLMPDKILGFAEIRYKTDNTKNASLHYLQIRPGAMNVNQNHKISYKYAGSAILSSLKKIYSDISLTADDDENVKAFYKKNKFIEMCSGSRYFAWSNSVIKRMILRIKKFRMEKGI